MRSYKRLMIFGINLFVFFFAQVALDFACGPEPDPYDYYVSFFHNTVQRNQDYWSFYFNGYTFLNDSENKVSETAINITEWRNYIGKKVKSGDVEQVLYNLDRKTDSLYFWNYAYGKTKFPDSLRQNTFIQALLRNRQAITYLALVKKTEPLVTQNYDDKWNAIPVDKKQMYSYSKAYLQRAIHEQGHFLKLRCFYQAQRLLHYAGYNAEAMALYNKYVINLSSKSPVAGWALSLKAGELQRLGHKAEAAYLFAKVFAGNPERRVQAYYSFSDAGTQLAQIVKLAKNGREKAYIYAIGGFHNPHIGLSALKDVYASDPNSNLIDVLLVREINKIEEGYLTPRMNGSQYYGSIGYNEHASYDSVKRSFARYIPQLQSFCYKLVTERKYKQPGIGYLAMAYLSWIQGHTDEGLQTLSKVKHGMLTKQLYDQLQLIKLLLLSQQIKELNPKSEKALLPSLVWLDQKVNEEKAIKPDSNKFYGDYDLKYYSASSRDFYGKVLGRIYLKQKDTAKAALCILKSERTIWPPRYTGNNLGLGFSMPAFWQNQIHSYTFKQILHWQRSPINTPYLALMLKSMNNQVVTNIYHLLGTAYLREHRYLAAARAFQHVPVKQLNKVPALANDSTTQYADPFTSQLRDFPRVYQSQRPKAYNQLSFALEMARLSAKIKKDINHAADYYFAMANGMYNTSYYGNAWYFRAYSRESEDIMRRNTYYDDLNYLRTQDAEQCFLKARQAGQSNEFKALCTFMAAKCRQKRLVYPTWPAYNTNEKLWNSQIKTFESEEAAYNKKFRQNLYYADLRRHYSGTRFYKTAIQECSYLRDFIKGKQQ